MANNPFDRVVINVRERPVSVDHNQLQSEVDRTIREMFDRYFLPRATSASDLGRTTPVTGFLGEAFKVRPVSPVGMQVQVTSGIGFFVDAVDVVSAIGSVAGVDDLSRFKPLYLAAATPLNIPAADPTNPRIDIIEVRHNRRLTDTASRDVLDPVTGAFNPTALQKTLAWDVGTSTGVVTSPAASTAAISYKAGVPAGVPAAPAVTTGYVKIAEIRVNAGVTTIDTNRIIDYRHMHDVHGMRRALWQGNLTAAGPVVAMERVVAPPGVHCIGNIVGGVRYVYVIAGDLTIAQPIALVTPVGATGQDGAEASIVNLTSTEATDLANASISAPNIALATGQPAIKIQISGSDGRKAVHVTF